MKKYALVSQGRPISFHDTLERAHKAWQDAKCDGYVERCCDKRRMLGEGSGYFGMLNDITLQERAA